jgi:signal transduction histidine kinase/ActR/RegA family two-component response regulator
VVHSADYVRAYAERYRDMFPVRLATIAGVSLLALWLVGPLWALNFAICQSGLYVVLWRLVQQARARPEAAGMWTRLRLGTEAVTLGLAVHNAVFSLAVWHAHPEVTRHIILLLLGNLMVGALQVHVSRRSFAAAAVPPSIAVLWMAAVLAPDNPGLQAAVVVFILAVIGAAWRQWQSDRDGVDLAVAATRRSRELQDALARAETEKAAADEANAAKSRFLAMISHEVRTPLNVMLGLTEVLRTRPRPAEEAAHLDDMAEAGDMLLRLLNDALDISKIESGKADLQLARVDLAERLDAIARVWRSRAHDLGLSLEVEQIGENADFVVLADQARVERVLINYLSNALKLSAAGTVRIVARARPDGGDRVSLAFEVHDQGPGVPEAQRERIFQPFEQLDDGRAVGGSGLGLALCRAAVEAMGGELGVRAAEPHGAIFWFSFTAERASAAETAATPRMITGPTPGRARVLAAEDNAGNRKLLALLVDALGHDLDLVSNGREAVTAVRQQTYDLVLMDVMMPVMDGLAALQAIREEEAATGRAAARIHMLTANVFDEDVARYMAAGANGVLRKPIEIAALETALADSLADAAPEARLRSA